MQRFLAFLLVCLLATPLALLDTHAQAVPSNADGWTVTLAHQQDQPCCDVDPSVRTASHCGAVDLAVGARLEACRQAPTMVLTYVVHDDRVEGLLPAAELDPPRLS